MKFLYFEVPIHDFPGENNNFYHFNMIEIRYRFKFEFLKLLKKISKFFGNFNHQFIFFEKYSLNNYNNTCLLRNKILGININQYPYRHPHVKLINVFIILPPNQFQ